MQLLRGAVAIYTAAEAGWHVRILGRWFHVPGPDWENESYPEPQDRLNVQKADPVTTGSSSLQSAR